MCNYAMRAGTLLPTSQLRLLRNFRGPRLTPHSRVRKFDDIGRRGDVPRVRPTGPKRAPATKDQAWGVQTEGSSHPDAPSRAARSAAPGPNNSQREDDYRRGAGIHAPPAAGRSKVAQYHISRQSTVRVRPGFLRRRSERVLLQHSRTDPQGGRTGQDRADSGANGGDDGAGGASYHPRAEPREFAGTSGVHAKAVPHGPRPLRHRSTRAPTAGASLLPSAGLPRARSNRRRTAGPLPRGH